MKTYDLVKCRIVLILIVFLIAFATRTAVADDMKKLVIIPFETNTENDLSYMVSGIQNMLESRLFWKNKVTIAEASAVSKAISEIKEMYESNAVMKIGEKTKADFVITGIITEFAGAYSVDTKVWNLKTKSYMTFFDQSETLDKLISKVDVVAAKINKKIFDRTTASYEKYKNEKIITEEDLRRMNPERMMPAPDTRERKKPWWKIW